MKTQTCSKYYPLALSVLMLVLLGFFTQNVAWTQEKTRPTPSPSPEDSESEIQSNGPDSDDLELPPLVMGQGEQRLLRIDGLQRFSLGSTIVRSLPLKSSQSLLLKAMAAGETDLIVWKSDGSTQHRTIRIEKISPTDLSPGLQKALSRLDQTEIVFSGSGVVLKGEVSQLAEASRIGALESAYPKEVYDETQLTPLLLKIGSERLEKWIQESKYSKDLRVEQFSGVLWVRGSLDRPSEKAVLERQLKAQFPLVQLEIEALPDNSPTVHFKVYLLELKRSKFHTLGLEWPGAQEGAFNVSAASITNQLSLDIKLHELEGEGDLKVLSNPELVVRAPGDAELFSGGEVPIISSSRFYSDTSWKTFGLTLKLKVTDSTREKARLDIFTEDSRLDPSISPDGTTPGFQSNRMKTQVDARYGVPLLLSGLLQEGTRKSAQGLPILRKIPILGALFGSEDYLQEKSELVAILMPSLTPPPPPMSRVTQVLPKGKAPLARNWISPEQQRELEASADYPWNALENASQ